MDNLTQTESIENVSIQNTGGYYENGQLWDEGTYEDSKKVGDRKVYDKAGALKQSKVLKAKR